MTDAKSNRLPATPAAPLRAASGVEIPGLEVGIDRSIELQLSISDPDVVAELMRVSEDERPKLALAAMRVGVLAMRNARGTIDVTAIRDEGRALMERLDQAVKAHQQDLENRLGHTLDKYLDPKQGTFSQKAEGLFGDSGALVAKLQEHISGENSHLARTLAKQIGDDSAFLRHFSPNEKKGVISTIEAAVSELLEEQKRVVLDEFDLGKDDSAINRLLRGVQKLNSEVTEHFSLEDEKSALSKLRAMLEETKSQIHKDLSLDEEKSSISRLNRELQERIKKLADEQTKFQAQVNETLQSAFARKAERDKSTLGGDDFEREAFDHVRELVAGPGDAFDEVGTKVGKLSGSKVGDAVLSLGEESIAPGARIVFEFKQDASYDQRKAREELDIAMTNREASVGVFVMSRPTALASRNAASWEAPLVRFGHQILVTWHPEDDDSHAFLAAACSLARALVLREQASAESQVEWGTVDAALLEIDKQIDRFEGISTQCNTIRRAADKIEEELRKLGKKLRLSAERLAEQVDALRGE